MSLFGAVFKSFCWNLFKRVETISCIDISSFWIARNANKQIRRIVWLLRDINQILARCSEAQMQSNIFFNLLDLIFWDSKLRWIGLNWANDILRLSTIVNRRFSSTKFKIFGIQVVQSLVHLCVVLIRFWAHCILFLSQVDH